MLCAMIEDRLQITTADGRREGQRVLRLAGPLTMTTLFDFQNRVRAETARTLILDFSGVPFIDSAGLGTLVSARVHCERDGRRLTLAGLNDRTRTLLRMTNVEQLFVIAPTVEAAEQASE
jgi:anti-sigma B factor antagonist